jgi:sporulation protein YabP
MEGGMDDKHIAGNHKLTLQHRNGLSLTGVLDVISFDLKEILLETTDGMLTIKGNDLHMNHLSVEKGEVNVEGRVDGLHYSDVVSAKAAGQNLLERLFK